MTFLLENQMIAIEKSRFLSKIDHFQGEKYHVEANEINLILQPIKYSFFCVIFEKNGISISFIAEITRK